MSLTWITQYRIILCCACNLSSLHSCCGVVVFSCWCWTIYVYCVQFGCFRVKWIENGTFFLAVIDRHYLSGNLLVFCKVLQYFGCTQMHTGKSRCVFRQKINFLIELSWLEVRKLTKSSDLGSFLCSCRRFQGVFA